MRRKRASTLTAWIALTLGLGAFIALWHPSLLALWIAPGVPPPGPLGGKR